MIVIKIIAAILASVGFIFMLSSVIGIYRFPDFYSRLHASGVGDTLGLMLMVLALILLSGFSLLSVKILLIGIIVMLTGPLGTNLIMAASIRKHNFERYNDKYPQEDLAEEGTDK